MSSIDPLKTEQLVSLLFDEQHSSVTSFQNDFSAEALSVCENLRDSWAGYLKFDHYKKADEQHKYLCAHLYTLIESQFTSCKLLVGGFLPPSGNQFRVALEAMATAILLSHRGNLLVQKRPPKWTSRNYFNDYKKERRWALPFKSIQIAKENQSTLKLPDYSIQLLEQTKGLYNNYSHASFLSLRASFVDSEKLMFGGGYDQNQKDIFKKELEIRSKFSSKIPKFLDALYERLA